MDIQKEIYQLKMRGRVQSNIYSEEVFNNTEEFICFGDTILLSKVDHGVKRLYYCTIQFDNLKSILSSLKHQEYILEFMTRNANENNDKLTKAGFKPKAKLMRMSIRDVGVVFNNKSIMQFYDESIGEKPMAEDSVAINRLLWHIFDTRISHLLNDKEIAIAIQSGQITVYKSLGNILSILQVTEEPKKFYINQIYNGGEKKIIHAMLLNRLKKYIGAGGKYAYSWVDQNNIASLKFHQKYGFVHDGMWNIIYSYGS